MEPLRVSSDSCTNAPNSQHVFFTDLPIIRANVAKETQTGIGDISVGYGFVPYENLERRFTTIAFRVETSMPTGDENRGLGLGTWVLSPAVGVAVNVTDLFPIYMVYAHLELLRCYYNFVRPHGALKFGRETRTPAMQAGLATRRLTLRDIFVSLERVVLWLSDVLAFADSRRTAAAAVMSMPVAA